MSAFLRRLLLTFALAGSGLVLTQLPAQACACAPDQSVRSHARQADVIFSGVLVDRRTAPRRNSLTLDVERIYQGRVDDSPVVLSSRRSSCGLGGLKVDRAYVVFATSASARLESAQCTGTARASAAYVAEVERVLGAGTAIPKPPPPGQDPPEPEYTRVADTDPLEFTRLAAPGGAMVLLGLLGLVVFRKRT